MIDDPFRRLWSGSVRRFVLAWPARSFPAHAGIRIGLAYLVLADASQLCHFISICCAFAAFSS
jgi:hypothetical protein